MLAQEFILQYFISWKIEAEHVLESSSTRKELKQILKKKEN